MHRPLLALLICCTIFSCKKVIKPSPCNCPVPIFKPVPTIPYDTANTTAIFIVQIVQDSSRTPATNEGYPMLFFTHNAQKAHLSMVSVTLNTNKLRVYEDGAYASSPNYYNIIDSFRLLGPISWEVGHSTNYDIAYTDSTVFPKNNIAFPNVINDSVNFTYSFDGVTNADTILVSISAPRAIDYPLDAYMEYHDSVTHFWTGGTSKQITIPANALYKFRNQKCVANISLFRHSYVTLNGNQYLFIKQYSFNKNVMVH